MIDWPFTIMLIITIAAIIVTIVIAIKFQKKKKPVWAYVTRRIIGLGTDAPLELKLLFNEKPIFDVYRTIFIFFNRGNETIRKNDVTDAVTVRFEGAELLRDAYVISVSKPEIRLSVINRGNNAFEIDFFYLDHSDGALVEVLHTKGERLTCSGNIMGVKGIAYMEEFDPFRPKFRQFFKWKDIISTGTLAIVLIIGVLLASLYAGKPFIEVFAKYSIAISLLVGMAFGSVLGAFTIFLTRLLYFRQFPNWSMLKE